MLRELCTHARAYTVASYMHALTRDHYCASTSSHFDKGSCPIVMSVPDCFGNECRLKMCRETTDTSMQLQ